MSHRQSKVLVEAEGTIPKKPASLRTLAEHLGLSRGTISLVLNSSPGSEAIPERTRKRIFDGARDLDYKPNYFARALSLKRSYMIGILTTSLAEGYDSSLLGGIERYLTDTQYVYFVASHLWSGRLLLRSLQTLLERGAEGIILINAEPPKVPINVPIITIGAGQLPSEGSRISIDNRLGAGLILRHLYELGHRKISCLRGDSHGLDARERWEGFKQAARELGLPIDNKLVVSQKHPVREGVSGIEQGAASTRELLRRSRNFTAIVCFNDMSAIGAMNQLRVENIDVPSQISVVGFDDIQLAKSVSPSLTTIRQPLIEMGQLAAERLVMQIEGDRLDARTDLIVPELIVRQSSSRVRSS